jgi:hypothetical protein
MPQPVPAVPQIPAGYGPLPADLALWVTDPFTYLATPATFRGQLQGSEGLAGWTLAALDTVLEDPYGGWSATATGSQPAHSWLCPAGCAGWFDATLSGFTGNQGSSSAQTATSLYLNGSLWQYGSDDWAVNGTDSGTSGAVQVPLLPGDYVQLYVYSTVSVNTPGTAGQYPSIELSWVSS